MFTFLLLPGIKSAPGSPPRVISWKRCSDREVWDMVPFNSRARSEEYSLNQQDSPTPGLCVHARL